MLPVSLMAAQKTTPGQQRRSSGAVVVHCEGHDWETGLVRVEVVVVVGVGVGVGVGGR